MTSDTEGTRFIQSEISHREIRFAVAVASQKGILGASRALNVAQPSISRCIRDLEERLGVALFTRTTKGSSLTPFGELFVRRGKRILADIGALNTEIGMMAAGHVGHIEIGAMPAVMQTFLPRALLSLHERYPGITINIREATGDQLVAALRDRRIDIAIGRLTSEHAEPDLCHLTLFLDDMAAIVNNRHPLLAESDLPIDVAYNHEWVFPAHGTVAHDILLTVFRCNGRGLPPIAFHSSSLEGILRLTAQSDLIGVAPAAMFDFPGTPIGISRLALRLEGSRAPIGITFLSDIMISPATQKLIDIVSVICSDLLVRRDTRL